MKSISEAMKAYMLTHPFDSGNSDCQTVLDQLYHAYAESHEHDPQEIGDGFKRSICVYCHWIITPQFSICVVACAVHMNARPFWPACNTALN